MNEKYSMAQGANQLCTAHERQPVAVEVMNYAQNLAGRAQTLAERLNGKLHTVMTSETPRACVASLKDGAEYPPLFSDLRNSFQGIDSALDSIEYALSRTEL